MADNERRSSELRSIPEYCQLAVSPNPHNIAAGGKAPKTPKSCWNSTPYKSCAHAGPAPNRSPMRWSCNSTIRQVVDVHSSPGRDDCRTPRWLPTRPSSCGKTCTWQVAEPCTTPEARQYCEPGGWVVEMESAQLALKWERVFRVLVPHANAMEHTPRSGTGP